jgi:hypothetical protein
MAPVGVDVVAAIALGVGIAAVAIDAITSPVAMSPAAMTVARVRVAVADVASGGLAEGCSTTFQTMKVTLRGMTGTMDVSRAIETRQPRRSNGATVKRTSESTARLTEGVRERRITERRTTGAKSGRRSANGRTAKAHRRRNGYLRERLVWYDDDGAEQHARGQGQKSFPQHSISPFS